MMASVMSMLRASSKRRNRGVLVAVGGEGVGARDR
jgi:hypothetical protein